MTQLLPDETAGAPHRVVLVDFSRRDADLLPDLLRHPGITVELVAGRGAEDAGVRAAELCGLPRSVELGDLTRRIFDLALVGGESPRRNDVERLMRALGTPVTTPQAFLSPESASRAAHGPNTNGRSIGELLDEALPDLTDAPPSIAAAATLTAPAPTWEVRPMPTPADAASAPVAPEEIPAPGDGPGLVRLLGEWLRRTGALAAEIRTGVGKESERLARAGAEDALLEAIAVLAQASAEMRSVSPVDGPDRGRAWCAWPFEAGARRAVLAVAGVDADGRGQWERLAGLLREAWLTPFPPVAAARNAREPLAPEAFRRAVEQAVTTCMRDGVPFTAHRFYAPDLEELVSRVYPELPSRMRLYDRMCRPAPATILMLCAEPPGAYLHVRKRFLALWEDAGKAAGVVPTPPIHESVELSGSTGVDGFLRTTRRWIEGL